VTGGSRVADGQEGNGEGTTRMAVWAECEGAGDSRGRLGLLRLLPFKGAVL